MKCIKQKCKYFLTSDDFDKCYLADTYCTGDSCVGHELIDPKIEEVAGKIMKLVNEYDRLMVLKSEIKTKEY